MEIRIEKDTIWIQDKAIFANKDGLYCLSELAEILRRQGLYERTTSAVMQRKGVREDISVLIGKDLTRSPNAIRTLKEKGLYVSSGRRNESRTYCTFDIFVTILWHYSRETRQALMKGILNDKTKRQ